MPATRERARPRPDDAGTETGPDKGSDNRSDAADGRATPDPRRVERRITLAVVAACTAFVVWELHPALVLADTTPTGSDLGAHAWGPWFMAEHLLGRGAWSGWNMDQFAGFPAYHFYPPLPGLLAAVGSFLLPDGVALKLVVIAGLATLPVAAWSLGRGLGLRFPFPALFAVASLFFAFDTTCSLCGGNIPATVSGEFSYSLGLSLAVAYLGRLAVVVRTGRGRALAALLLAAAALSHPLPFGVALLGTAVIVVAFTWRADEAGRRLAAAGAAVGAGLAVAAVWWLPFIGRSGYLTSPGFAKRTDLLDWLLPFPWWTDALVLVLVAAAITRAVARRDRGLLALAAFTGLAGVLFAAAPQGHVWNLRIWPAWQLGVLLLAAAGAGDLLLRGSHLFDDPRRRRRAGLAVPGVALLVVLTTIALSWALLPFGTETPVDAPTASAGPAGPTGSTGDRQNVTVQWPYLPFTVSPPGARFWAQDAFAGYQRRDDWPELDGLVSTMRRLGAERGCARVTWDFDREETAYGSPYALELLPMWTDGCITTTKGLWQDSSATTPYLAQTEALVSWFPDYFVKSQAYGRFDLATGVANLRTLGVRYYLARKFATLEKARGIPELTEVATSGPWHVFEIRDSAVVAPLLLEPAVAPKLSGASPDEWVRATNEYNAAATSNDLLITTDGPARWPRLSPTAPPPLNDLPRLVVTDVRVDDDSVAFHVDRTGIPVAVRVSYFPTWSVEGADGPYRTTQNLMVVVPQANDVVLRTGRTALDWTGLLIALAGMVATVALWWRDRRRLPLDDVVVDADR